MKSKKFKNILMSDFPKWLMPFSHDLRHCDFELNYTMQANDPLHVHHIAVMIATFWSHRHMFKTLSHSTSCYSFLGVILSAYKFVKLQMHPISTHMTLSCFLLSRSILFRHNITII